MCVKLAVVQKIHDNVFLGLHYTIFCIRMNSRRICRSYVENHRQTAGTVPKMTVQPFSVPTAELLFPI